MISIFIVVLKVLNVMPHPYRFYAFSGLGMIAWYLLFSVHVAFSLFFLLRNFSKKYSSYNRLTTLSLSPLQSLPFLLF
ncbi:MAG: hypothetical protein HZR80_18390 [Candidatus Heimdallarchaeota archaeon]